MQLSAALGSFCAAFCSFKLHKAVGPNRWGPVGALLPLRARAFDRLHVFRRGGETKYVFRRCSGVQITSQPPRAHARPLAAGG
eukprot:9613048-Alexandrium_andersonii.AAC.1